MNKEKTPHCHQGEGHSHKKKVWYAQPLLWTFSGTSVLLILSGFIPFLEPFRMSFFHYLDKIWLAIFLGLILGGVIDYYVPQTYISKHLAGGRKRTIVKAVGLGFLMSGCSHGILALSMELYKKGAATASTVSFLLASPWANLPITFLFFGFFGWKAFFIIGASLIIALTTGWIFLVLEKVGWVESNTQSIEIDAAFSVRKDILEKWRAKKWNAEILWKDIRGVTKGAFSLANMILWWLLIGMTFASLASAYVPASFFQNYLGPTLRGLLITLFFATVIEVCSEGAAPLAFEIYRQTAAFGNAFVFLMAGVVTDLTEIGLIWINIGKRAAIWMVLVTVPQALFFGWLFNRFLSG